MKEFKRLEDINDIDAFFVSSTNPQAADWLHNKFDGLEYRGDILWFGSFHTSYVVKATLKGNILTVKTRNSEYVWRLAESYKECVLKQKGVDELEAHCKVIDRMRMIP